MFSKVCVLAVGMTFGYILLIGEMVKFITRDLTEFEQALKAPESTADIQSYRKFLIHQPIENLFDRLVPEEDKSLPTQAEDAYIREQIERYEVLVGCEKQQDGGNQMDRPKKLCAEMGMESGPINMTRLYENIYHDNFYKRVLIDVLVERQFGNKKSGVDFQEVQLQVEELTKQLESSKSDHMSKAFEVMKSACIGICIAFFLDRLLTPDSSLLAFRPAQKEKLM